MQHFPFIVAPEIPKKDLVAALIMRDKKLLLVHNIKHGLRIEPPGGKRNADEQGWDGPRKAVVREVMEELRMKVNVLRLAAFSQTDTPEGPFDVWTYVCDSDDEPQRGCEPGKIGDFQWVNADELRALAEQVNERGEHILVQNIRQSLANILRLLEAS